MDDCVRGDHCRVRHKIFERERIAGLAIEYLAESGVPAGANRARLICPSINGRGLTGVVSRDRVSPNA
jgi:hypothetical protein